MSFLANKFISKLSLPLLHVLVIHYIYIYSSSLVLINIYLTVCRPVTKQICQHACHDVNEQFIHSRPVEELYQPDWRCQQLAVFSKV